MIRYGARLGHLKGEPDEVKMDLAAIEASAERLSKPRRSVKKFVYESKGRSQHHSTRMDDLFPPHEDVDEVASVTAEAQYPEDWRRLPSEPAGVKLKWIYEYAKLDIDTPLAKSEALLRSALERKLRDGGVAPVAESASRKEIREIVREGDRFGVLIDIVATRRNILSGVPHQLAAHIYQLLEEEYPISVKFSFIGITDNATKLVAKDIFDSRSGGGAKKLTFADIDSEHLHVAYPKPNEAEMMRQRGIEEAQRKEMERKARSCTAKYQPPSEPSWMAGARVASERAKVFLECGQPKREYHSFCTSSCSRCWAHGRSDISKSQVASTPESYLVNDVDALSPIRRGGPPEAVSPLSKKPAASQKSQGSTTVVEPASSVRTESNVYTMQNCVDRLRTVRRQHRLEKGAHTKVSEAMVLKTVMEHIAAKKQ